VKDFLVLEPFGGDGPLNIPASAGHGTLSFVDEEGLTISGSPPAGTISETGTLAQINDASASGIVYTPDHPLPGIDNVSITVANSYGGNENINLMFRVLGSGPATFNATA